MQSDTPRTDANVWVTRVEVDDPELGLVVVEEHVVDADFARQLERDLAAANARIRDLRDEVSVLRLYGDKHRTAIADDALVAMRRTGDPVRDLCGGSDCDLDGEKLVAMRRGDSDAK